MGLDVMTRCYVNEQSNLHPRTIARDPRTCVISLVSYRYKLLHTLRRPSQSPTLLVKPAQRWILAGDIGFRVAAEQLADLRTDVP